MNKREWAAEVATFSTPLAREDAVRDNHFLRCLFQRYAERRWFPGGPDPDRLRCAFGELNFERSLNRKIVVDARLRQRASHFEGRRGASHFIRQLQRRHTRRVNPVFEERIDRAGWGF